jgi:trehalose-6-phosphate synthase
LYQRIELTQLPKVLESKDGVTERVAPPDLMTLAGVDKHVVVRELRNKMEVLRHVFVLVKSKGKYLFVLSEVWVD